MIMENKTISDVKKFWIYFFAKFVNYIFSPSLYFNAFPSFRPVISQEIFFFMGPYFFW